MRWVRAPSKRQRAIRLKTAREIEAMARAGRIVAEVLRSIQDAVRPGVTTAELDRLAEAIITAAGGIPSFRGVPAPVSGVQPYPAATCISVNDEVVHGIPDSRELREGDIVSVDVGVILNGWHGDAAVTFPVGTVSEEVAKLVEAARGALAAGVAKAQAGGWLGDISAAIQEYAEARGYSVVREYTGHGIGREMWEGFQVPNFGQPGTGLRLRPGMTMAIEPMLNLGGPETTVRENGWTVATSDGKPSAHFEHTIAVTERGPIVLTTL